MTHQGACEKKRKATNEPQRHPTWPYTQAVRGQRQPRLCLFSVPVTASKDRREAMAALLVLGGDVCFGMFVMILLHSAG